METTIKLYTYVDGVNDTPFPSVEHQIITGAFTYNASRMSGAPTISFDAFYPTCLDDVWTKNVYAEFNGEKYFISKIPTSSYDNTAITYKHSVELVSERVALENVYFYDVVSTLIDDKPVSNSSIVNFSGDIHQFVARLNHSLVYAKLQTVDENGNYVSGYRVVVDEDVESEEHFMSFEDEFFANVLQEIYNVYEIPYYFVGKDIHIGHNAPEIDEVFAYGSEDALLSISKTNANFRVVTRATGEGSEENIPFYYPNQTPLGDVSLDTISGSTVASIKDVDKFGGSGLLDKTLTYMGAKPVESIQNNAYVTTNDGEGKYDIEGNNLLSLDRNEKINIDKGFTLCAHIKNISDSQEKKKIHLNWQWENTANMTNYSALNGAVEFLPTSIMVSKNGGEFIAIQNYEVLSFETKIPYWWYRFTYDTQTAYRFVEVSNIEKEFTLAKGVVVPLDLDPNVEYKVFVHGVLTVRGFLPTYSQTLQSRPRVDDSYMNYHTLFHLTTNITLETNKQDILYGWVDENEKQYDLEKYGIVLSQEPSVGDSFKVNLVHRWDVQKRLMPSIYRESNEQERFYNAISGAYTDDLGNEIVFANTYSDSNRKEQIVEFSDIKPTIEEMTNGSNERIDMFLEFAYDENDNDDTEEIDGSLVYKHPYFFGKLRKFDGDNGFNLFDHAIENGEMTIEMTSGSCGACKFVIAVDEELEKNTVQVDENGDLLRDENGNVRCGRENYQTAEVPQDRQQDTKNYEVWVALRKDVDTFGVIMPHTGLIEGTDVETTAKYRPKSVKEDVANGSDGSGADTFVITNIHLPHGYITNAEKKLEKEVIKYLVENNDEKFNFAIKFSRIYLAENPDVLTLLNENTKLHINYNNNVYDLYVSSYSYKMSDNEALPEITVELTDTLSIRQNAIQKAVSSVESKIMNSIGSGTGFASWQSLTPFFLQKNRPDVAEKKITFREGVEFGEYNSGALGTGGAIGVDGNGNTVAELDFLTIRKKATFKEITIQELKNVGGELVLSPAAMECSSVTELEDVYRCYFEKQSATGEQINNEFEVGDQARCQVFNMAGSRYYWRLVVAVGEDYIDLSKEDCDANSDAPLSGDKITSLGNRTVKERQAAIILSAYSNNAPSMTQYAGIDGFTLEGKMVTKFSNGDNVITGKMTILPNSTGAANLADLEIGASNMIRNSGFTGDYVSKELDDDVVLEAATQLYSDPLDHWEALGRVVVQDSEESQSGKEVVLAKSSISQQLENRVIANENYVLSFKAKGSIINYRVGGVFKTIALTEQYEKYIEHIVPIEENDALFISGGCTLCDLKLERGTIATDWAVSPLDNNKELSEVQSMHYLKKAISEGNTEIVGGLVLSNIIKVGEHDDGEFKRETGGMSGYWSNDNDVAFWAGGSMSKAIKTAQLYKNDASYQPTQAELTEMAKFVVTHGGRAILNDIILRGYIYAQGGNFGNLKIGKWTNACGIEDDYVSIYSERETQRYETDNKTHYYKDVVKIDENAIAFESTHNTDVGCIRGNSIVIDASHDFDNENNALIFAEVGNDNDVKAIKVFGDVVVSGVIENYNNVIYHTNLTQLKISQSGVKVLVSDNAYDQYSLRFTNDGASVEFYLMAGKTLTIDGGQYNKLYYDGTLGSIIYSDDYDVLRIPQQNQNLFIKATYFNKLDGYTTDTHGYFITITKNV